MTESGKEKPTRAKKRKRVEISSWQKPTYDDVRKAKIASRYGLKKMKDIANSCGFDSLPGQSGEAHVFLIQDDNLAAEVPLRRSILRQKYRSTGKHNPQRDGGPEKGLYRLHPIALHL